MRDFTLIKYKKLLSEFLKNNFKFLPFEEFIQDHSKISKIIILRHDVDKKPLRSLRIAKIENELKLKGTYYFRVKKLKKSRKIILQILKYGHEIGYHYEDLDVSDGDMEKAIDSFMKNLERLRELTPVQTACMHGSPLSKYDNRDMWKDHSYREFGIIGEPYFDVDFSKVMYLTDTGRRWDGTSVSIRDKVRGEGVEARGQRSEVRSQKTEVSRGEEDRGQKSEDREEAEESKQKQEDRRNEAKERPRIHSTNDLIKAIQNDQLPDQIMLTVHPQRWTDEWGPWVRELISQKVKNGVKYLIVRYRGRRLEVRGER